jgi:hypothetical protein
LQFVADLRGTRGGTMLRAMKGDVLAVLGLVAALVFQTWVTLKVRRSSLYEPSEKRAQTRLIWLVPVLGAVVSFAMLEKDDHPPRDDDTTKQA